MIFKNCTFFNEFFEKEFGDIEVENGKIKQIGVINGDGKDMSGYILVPGFIDLHMHGCAGGDSSDANVESLEKITKELAKNGVTSFLPTTMTIGREQLIDAVSVINNFESHGSKIAGIHLEGPYIAMSKKGAQNPDYVRAGTIEELDELIEASGDKIKLITIAPEAFESKEFIEYANKKCTLSIGHSTASAEQCKEYFDLGINHVTHLYNAMTPMSHREAGIVGTALDDERVFCQVICDGGHICPAVVRNTFDILGEDRAVVISDSMRGTGLGVGEFELGGQQVFVYEDSKYATLADGTIAASISNIHKEFKNLIEFGIDFKTALKSCTINPARAINEEDKIGSIQVGKCADLVFLDDNLDIKEVYIDGILA